MTTRMNQNLDCIGNQSILGKQLNLKGKEDGFGESEWSVALDVQRRDCGYWSEVSDHQRETAIK